MLEMNAIRCLLERSVEMFAYHFDCRGMPAECWGNIRVRLMLKFMGEVCGPSWGLIMLPNARTFAFLGQLEPKCAS